MVSEPFQTFLRKSISPTQPEDVPVSIRTPTAWAIGDSYVAGGSAVVPPSPDGVESLGEVGSLGADAGSVVSTISVVVGS